MLHHQQQRRRIRCDAHAGDATQEAQRRTRSARATHATVATLPLHHTRTFTSLHMNWVSKRLIMRKKKEPESRSTVIGHHWVSATIPSHLPILYPLCSMLYPLSSILYPLSSILYPLCSTLYAFITFVHVIIDRKYLSMNIGNISP